MHHDQSARPFQCSSSGLRRWVALSLCIILFGGAPVLFGQTPTAKYIGTYRIADWRDFEAKQLFHFFYLHPNGEFLLGAEWPGRETSRAVGTWRVAGNFLTLAGKAFIETNQGNWNIPFSRTYKIIVNPRGIGLKPIPEKNRFGLLGWPDTYFYYRERPTPNLPGGGIQADPEKIRETIRLLLARDI